MLPTVNTISLAVAAFGRSSVFFVPTTMKSATSITSSNLSEPVLSSFSAFNLEIAVPPTWKSNEPSGTVLSVVTSISLTVIVEASSDVLVTLMMISPFLTSVSISISPFVTSTLASLTSKPYFASAHAIRISLFLASLSSFVSVITILPPL